MTRFAAKLKISDELPPHAHVHPRGRKHRKSRAEGRSPPLTTTHLEAAKAASHTRTHGHNESDCCGSQRPEIARSSAHVTPRQPGEPGSPADSTQPDSGGLDSPERARRTPTSELDLLPPELLVRTSEIDRADWNYRLGLGAIQRARFRLARSLLGEERHGSLLEVGFGSGVFLPTLAQHCDELFAVDTHPHRAEVAERLAAYGVRASLHTASATALPFSAESFDVIVGVSCFEFIEGVDIACKEFKRVLRPGGYLVVVTPGHSPLLDWGLEMLTDASASEDFGDRRKPLATKLLDHFELAEHRSFLPGVFGRVLPRLYNGFRLLP
jgi:ubiquinone/menaquinone biosynthesis C-methylase UbiE